MTSENILGTNASPSDLAEIKTAILSLKSGKARGLDAVHVETLKADILTSTKVLTDLL